MMKERQIAFKEHQIAFENMGISLDEKADRAKTLLREHEKHALKLSSDGYFLGFSGGKDSVVIKQIAIEAGVKFKSFYSQTTIDPPELVRFIREYHRDVEWIRPKRNFFRAMQDKGLPSRLLRWCCELYKEQGGTGLVKVLGVRASESVKRAKNWQEITLWRGEKKGYVVAPIVHWTDADVWGYIRLKGLPYCSLYNEGWKRLGCVGCPMAGKKRLDEFQRWPGFEKQWKRGAREYYESHNGKKNRKGKTFYVSRFANWQEMWDWWLSDNPGPEMKNECLGLFSEEDLIEAIEGPNGEGGRDG